MFSAFKMSAVKLLSTDVKERELINRKYMLSLEDEDLLQNYYVEAGLIREGLPEDCHGGCESPTCQVRGHFLGHWLSAAAMMYTATSDFELKAKADKIISELVRCQKENGGEWAGSIPEKYLEWIANGKNIWAPQYTVHKTLMGLYDMYMFSGNEQALEILTKWAGWFSRWTKKFTREKMDEILDYETGGMMEVWANLYGITGKSEHLELMETYARRCLFDRLLKGEDVLTNMHANTTIPEVLGAARAYEVAGDDTWRSIVERYWRCAVTERGYFCTGGQSSGELWTPPFKFFSRLGENTQEHCTVYNMTRLAEYLLRWTGDVHYSDYIERNLYNGIMAQHNPITGMTAYFLPLGPGSQKKWSTPTQTFWCCCGTMLQAQSMHRGRIYYIEDDGIAITQYIPSELNYKYKGSQVDIKLNLETQCGNMTTVKEFKPGKVERPDSLIFDILIRCNRPEKFAIKLRIPWWVSKKPVIRVNGIDEEFGFIPSSYYVISRCWKNDSIRIEFPKALSCCPLPDKDDMVAFMDGPVVLAGICEDEKTIYGDINKPGEILKHYDDRLWEQWGTSFYTQNQRENIKFIPLYKIIDEKYTVYFPIHNDGKTL